MILKYSHALALVITILASGALSVLFTWLELPMLRRLKAGQSIREEGPQSHMVKSGTPTMGGIAIILALVLSGLLFGFSKDMLLCVFVTLAYGAIGFIDDYIKVVKHRNLGLTGWQKIALQVATALVLAIYKSSFGTEVFIPIWKHSVNFGWLYIPFVVFVVVAMTNAVNLTDGLDGLASSVTAVAALCFALICSGASMVFAAALCGACLGFLVFNHHPAQLFMGDTGSLALGGALAAIAILSGYELILPVAGGIYVLEALSVIIQVFVFKTQNGRRFFRMAPLHHHFELGGWSEVKVVCVFSVITGILAVISLLIV